MAKDILKNTAIYTVLGFLPLTFAVLFTPIYLTYLGKAEYGILNLFLLYSGLIAQIYSLGVSSASGFFYWDVYKDRLELKKLMSSTITLLLLIQLFFMLVGFFFGKPILSLLVKNEEAFSYSPYFLLSLVYSGFMVFYEFFLYYFRNEGKLGRYATLSISTLILFTVASILGVIVFDLKALGAILGRTFGYGIVVLVFLVLFIKEFGFSFEFKQAKKILIFSLPLAVNTIIGAVGYSLDRLLVERFDTIESLGVYGFAIVVVSVVEIWFNSLNNALSPTLYKFINESVDLKSKEIQALTHLISIAVIVAVVVLIAILFPILDLLIPENFHLAAKYIPLLGVSLIWRVFTTISSYSLYSKKKTKFMLINQSSNMIVLIILGYLFYNLWGIMGIVFAVYLVKVIEFCLMKLISDKVMKLPLKLSRFIILTILITISTIVTTYCTDIFPNNYIRYLLPALTAIIFIPALLSKEIKNLLFCLRNRKVLFNS